MSKFRVHYNIANRSEIRYAAGDVEYFISMSYSSSINASSFNRNCGNHSAANHVRDDDATDYDAEVAIAILYQGSQFLLQLRDDIPTIVYPGHWAFCGGHLEPGEDADIAVVRELQEEIAYVPPDFTLFRRIIGPTQGGRKILRNFYQAKLTVPLSQLELNEGQELSLANIEDIQRGHHFSQKHQEDRPMPPQHRQVLLELIQEVF